MSNFKDSGDEVKQGRYANALIYFLMAIIVTVIPILFYRNNQLVKERNADEEKDRAREDAVRIEVRKECKEEMDVARQELVTLRQEVRDLRDETISDLRAERARSEILASQSRRALKSIQVETQKTKQANKELDSVSKSLTQ
jgi:cell division protein FtsB